MIANPIWAPKYCTKMVLIDRLKVNKTGKTFLFFCCDRNYLDLYSIDSEKVRKECKLVSNSKILCYQVPLDWLENEGELPKEYIKVREREYNKYKKYKEKLNKKGN